MIELRECMSDPHRGVRVGLFESAHNLIIESVKKASWGEMLTVVVGLVIYCLWESIKIISEVLVAIVVFMDLEGRRKQNFQEITVILPRADESATEVAGVVRHFRG